MGKDSGTKLEKNRKRESVTVRNKILCIHTNCLFEEFSSKIFIGVVFKCFF